MKDWIVSRTRRERMERKRRQRLMRKIQKAKTLARAEEVFNLPSWGKRFRRTARLRVQV
jgi:hypothetical protein